MRILFLQAKKIEAEVVAQAKAWMEMVAKFLSQESRADVTKEDVEGQKELLEQAWGDLSRLGRASALSAEYLGAKSALRKWLKEMEGPENGAANEQFGQLLYPRGCAGLSEPITNLKKFSGEFTEWTTFKESFIVDVHLKAFTDAEKLRRLKHCVAGGTADHLIRKFKVIKEGHYVEAWECLLGHYSSALGTFTGHMKRILDLKPVAFGDDTGMRDTLGQLEASLEGVLEVTTPEGFADAFSAMWLESRMDNKTRDQFRMDRIGMEGVPSLKEVADFARAKARNWAIWKQERGEERPSKADLVEKHAREIISRKTYGAEQGTSALKSKLKLDGGPMAKRANRSWARCYRCNNDHIVALCDVFRKDSMAQRKKFLEEKKLCLSCARPHIGKCTASCNICKGPHAEIMCEEASA